MRKRYSAALRSHSETSGVHLRPMISPRFAFVAAATLSTTLGRASTKGNTSSSSQQQSHVQTTRGAQADTMSRRDRSASVPPSEFDSITPEPLPAAYLVNEYFTYVSAFRVPPCNRSPKLSDIGSFVIDDCTATFLAERTVRELGFTDMAPSIEVVTKSRATRKELLACARICSATNFDCHIDPGAYVPRPCAERFVHSRRGTVEPEAIGICTALECPKSAIIVVFRSGPAQLFVRMNHCGTNIRVTDHILNDYVASISDKTQTETWEDYVRSAECLTRTNARPK
jgi:hypothetical protein